MGVITPKYDNDTITYGYLKQYLEEKGGSSNESSSESSAIGNKNYSTTPIPPYYKDSLLILDKKIYRCTTNRLEGQFNWNDWELISDGKALENFIDSTYKTDLLEIENQLDGAVETHYQEEDPAINWTTTIDKETHVGDYWYNTSDKKQWRYTKNTSVEPFIYEWKLVDVPSTIYDMIDTKKSIYTEKPTKYNKDDMWIIEDTISDEDIPIGSEENPIKKGDWVFSLSNSDSYNKEHWVKKDEKVNVEYLESHYYTTEEIEKKLEVVDSNIETNITKSKEDILLEVGSSYTTIETTNKVVKDYGEVVETLTEEIKTNREDIVSLNVEKDRITNRITSISKNIDEVTGEIREVKTSTGYTFGVDGLEIAKDGKPTKSKMDEAGNAVIDNNSAEEKLLFYSGYVTDEIADMEESLDDYRGKTAVFTKDLVVKEYVTFPNGRLENVYSDKHGKGIGLFM